MEVAKFLYSAAMSVDGFIAGPNGDMSWLTDYLGPNPTVDELIPQVGAILAGRRRFSGDDPYKGQPGEGEAFGGGWDGPQFVLTHRPPATRFPAHLRHQPRLGRRRGSRRCRRQVRRLLGADVAAQCLRAGVLDEVLVSVTPVLLGEGTRLFEHPGGATVKLQPLHATHTPNGTSLWFRVTSPPGRAPEPQR